MKPPLALTIRPVVYADKAALVLANRTNRDFHRPWVDSFIDDEGYDKWWDARMTGPHMSFVALDGRTGNVAGVVNLSEIVMGRFRSAYLGYYGMREACGKGAMTAAVREVVGVAFERMRLHRLEANIQPGNERSIRLVQRLGFSREGYSPAYLWIDGAWRDHERWALLAGE